MSQALYRKYRSKKLSEIVGQEHITRTLENALKTGKLSHAYLFTGPRGVGKTSIARILAHEINQLPYTDESVHLDIIEIDAASNRRIDEIRDLRDKVHIAPTSGKYKVYIIDEVHMLTKEAFNALLKTLEEPPAHVVFVLATTELHKLPETIISRTQRFTFKLIDDATVASHLKEIAKNEGMQIDDEVFELLAAHGRGSFRDSISLLDQVGHSGQHVTLADAERLVGRATTEHIVTLLDTVMNGATTDVLSALDRMTEAGINPAQTARQLAAEIRRRFLLDTTDQRMVQLLGELLEVSASQDPAGKLEVVLLGANLGRQNPSTQTVPLQAAQTAVLKQPVSAPPKPEPARPEPAVAETPPAKAPVADTTPSSQVAGEPAAWWQDVLTEIKTINNTLYGAMRMASAVVDGETLHLGFKFKLHAKKVTEAEVQRKLHEVIEKVTGKTYQIQAVVDKNLGMNAATETAPQTAAPNAGNPPIDSVKNIFGGGEVLES